MELSKDEHVVVAVVAVILAVTAIAAVIASVLCATSAVAGKAQDEAGASYFEDVSMSYESMFQSQVDSCLAAVDANPADSGSWIKLGDAYYLWASQIIDGALGGNPEQHYEQAVSAYSEGVRLDEASAGACDMLGYANFEWANYLRDSDAASSLGYKASDLYRQAVQWFDKAVALDEGVGTYSDQEISNMLVNEALACLELGEADDAVKMLERRRLVDGDHVQLLLNLGICYESVGRNQDAATCYRDALDAAREQGADGLVQAAQARIDSLLHG